MNNNNLISLNKRDKNEAKRIQSLGGLVSGEKRRKKKELLESIKWFLELKVNPSYFEEIKKDLGTSLENEDQTYLLMFFISLYKKVLDSNKVTDSLSFLELIMRLLQGNPIEKVEITTKDTAIVELKEYLKFKKKKFNENPEF